MEMNLSVEALVNLLENNKRLLALGDRKKLFNFMLDEAIRLSGAERGFVILFQDPDFEVMAARNFDQESLKKAQNKFSKTILAQVRETRAPVLHMDAEKEEELKKSKSIMEMALRSVLSVPIQLGENLIGALYLDNRFTAGAFQEDQVRLLELFADQAALSLKIFQSLSQAEEHAAEMELVQAQLAKLNQGLQNQIEQAVQERDQAKALLGKVDRVKGFPGIIGNSKPLRKVLGTIKQLKDAEPSTFIHGESGTGKELIARAIHQHSPRRKEKFLAINCAAFSEQILDSELFGHVRGAFTGADRERKGLFEVADRGTLFMDEVGEMSPSMQAKLLRVLQEGEIRPVGSNRSKKVDVRVVSASNKDLKVLAGSGAFREDLYYRLNVVRLELPALRERKEDIPDLVRFFMEQNDSGIPKEFLSIEETALASLINYDWPGNIRELQNEIQRCLILGKGEIKLHLLSPRIQEQEVKEDLVLPGGTLNENLKKLERQMVVASLEDAKGNKNAAAETLGISRTKLYQLIEKHGLRADYGRINLGKIRKALRETKGNKSLAAKRLGIGRRTLYQYLEKLS